MRRPALIATTAFLLLACNAAEADDIRDQLRDDDYRETYARAPGWEQPRQPSQGGPHGPFVDIYVNDVVEDAVASGEALDRWPEGSLVVKDGWGDADGEDYEYLAFMERRGDGWFWAEYDDDGRLVSAGLDDSTCAGCHEAGQDSVRAFDLPGG